MLYIGQGRGDTYSPPPPNVAAGAFWGAWGQEGVRQPSCLASTQFLQLLVRQGKFPNYPVSCNWGLSGQGGAGWGEGVRWRGGRQMRDPKQGL